MPMMCVGRVHDVVSIVSFDGAAVRSQCYQLACRTFAMHILSRELHNSIRGEVRLSAHVSTFLETTLLATSESGTGVLHVLLVQPPSRFCRRDVACLACAGAHQRVSPHITLEYNAARLPALHQAIRDAGEWPRWMNCCYKFAPRLFFFSDALWSFMLMAFECVYACVLAVRWGPACRLEHGPLPPGGRRQGCRATVRGRLCVQRVSDCQAIGLDHRMASEPGAASP